MLKRKKFRLKLASRTLLLGERTLVMGVLNVTPDSFSDGGKFFDAERAIEQALAMERAGADLLDIGGESTRPGSVGISAQEELARVLPVLQALRGRMKIPVSIDTQKPEVAEAALDAGAQIINDISGLKNDPRIAEAAARRRVPLEIVTCQEPNISVLYERKLVLVRPDGHVAWRGDTLPPDATA